MKRIGFKLFGKVCLVPLVCAVVACSPDERYNAENLDKIDTTLNLFEDGLEFPVGTMDLISASSLADTYPTLASISPEFAELFPTETIFDVVLPSDLTLETEDTIELTEGFGSIISEGLSLDAAIVNTMPLTAELKLDFVDDSGNVLAICEDELTLYVPCGNSNGRLVISPLSGAPTDAVAGLRISAVLKPTGERAMEKDDSVTAAISANLGKGITINPGEE